MASSWRRCGIVSGPTDPPKIANWRMGGGSISSVKCVNYRTKSHTYNKIIKKSYYFDPRDKYFYSISSYKNDPPRFWALGILVMRRRLLLCAGNTTAASNEPLFVRFD